MTIKRYNGNKTRKFIKKTNRKRFQRRTGREKRKLVQRNKNNHTHKLKPASIALSKVNCSPKDKKEIKNYTCYTDTTLFKLRDRWNLRHPDVKILTNDSKEIHKLLSNYLSDVCNKESCWLKQKDEFGQLDENFKDSFAPESPYEWKKNPNEWLSSIDIIKVMKQYEKAYKCFDFIGPSPIDFDKKKVYGECVWEELCNFNLEEQIKKGKTKIGIIFNTDPHDKPGEHWISMFINIKKGHIFFFDSVGRKAPPEIMKFVEKIKMQGKQLNHKINFAYDENHPVEHQYGNTECGIYSIFFVVHMLEDKLTEYYLKTHILKDKYMEKFRKIYFNEQL
uniref:Ubiquitin-like protease family profile domain-containing protein n=1 Tax=viral metagenome TaxID=1070528 RepID=A0A6C0JG41_9ZZZZ